MKALDDLLLEIGGDLTEAQVNEAIDNWLQENQNNLEQKLEGYGKLIRSKDATQKALAEERDFYGKKATVEKNGVERLKKRLLEFFTDQNITEIQSGNFRFKVTQNGGTASLVIDEEYDLKKIPKRFFKQVLDEDAVRKALESGEELAFAKLKRGQHVRLS